LASHGAAACIGDRGRSEDLADDVHALHHLAEGGKSGWSPFPSIAGISEVVMKNSPIANPGSV
jgi:hypothetical protein